MQKEQVVAYQGNIAEFTWRLLGSCTDSFDHEKRCVVDIQAEKATNDLFYSPRGIGRSQ